MNNTQTTIGEKIRKYRKRAGLSQFELEMQIGASYGSMSRIENGAVNPSKETLLKLSEVFNLKDYELADLMSIDLMTPLKVVEMVQSISKLTDLNDLLQTAINEITIQLGYSAGGIFLLEGDKLTAKYLSHTEISNKVERIMIKYIKKRFNQLYVSNEIEPNNLLLRSALDRSVNVSRDLYDFSKGPVSKVYANLIAKAMNSRQCISVPIQHESKSVGAYFLARSNVEDYSLEIPLLEAVGRLLGMLIYNINLIQIQK